MEYKCDYCEKTYKTEKGLVKHTVDKHPAELEALALKSDELLLDLNNAIEESQEQVIPEEIEVQETYLETTRTKEIDEFIEEIEVITIKEQMKKDLPKGLDSEIMDAFHNRNPEVMEISKDDLAVIQQAFKNVFKQVVNLSCRTQLHYAYLRCIKYANEVHTKYNTNKE